MSLVDKYRPVFFDEIIGQDHVKNTLVKIIKEPGRYPKNFIFSGPFGTGKTTASRAFFNELKKVLPDTTIHEFKSVDFRKADAMDSVKNLFDNVFKFTRNYSVVILNEFQLATQAAQSALLETLEDNENCNVFFIFTTTDKSKLLPTIISRCLEFDFTLIELSQVREYLEALAKKLNIEVSPDDLDYISKIGGGHVRDSVKYLDMISIDRELFYQNIRAAEDRIYEYLSGSVQGLEKVIVYDAGRLNIALANVVQGIIDSNIDTNFMGVSGFFEQYMKYKVYITSIEDIIGVLKILKNLNKKLNLK